MSIADPSKVPLHMQRDEDLGSLESEADKGRNSTRLISVR